MSGEIAEAGKIQYLCKLLRGETLCEFKKILAHITHSTNINLNKIILGTGTYLFPINNISK